MSAGGILSLLLGVVAGAFVLVPLLRRDAARAEIAAAGRGEERDLQSKQEMILASIKDLEDDRATDKIDEADYRELKARLSAEAVEIMRRMDDLQSAKAPGGGPRPVPPREAGGA